MNQIGTKNLYFVEGKRFTQYYSYKTLVGVYSKNLYTLYVTSENYSQTTTKHVNYIKKLYPTSTIKTISPKELDHLLTVKE